MNKSVINKIPLSRSYQAVSCKDGTNECPNPKWHFHGCAREVFGYLERIRQQNNHGGFLFMRIDNIVAHTKDYGHKQRPYSKIQVKRALAVFQQLGIIGKYETRIINGHAKRGWQMASHFFWAEVKGGICDFKHWPEFEPVSNEQHETDNDTADDTADDTDLADNDTADDTAKSIIIASK